MSKHHTSILHSCHSFGFTPKLWRCLLCVLWLILIALPTASNTQVTAPPNVLFIIADDMNTDLGCYGNKIVKSPNIDQLAKTGLRFDRAYVQYPVCNPSRSSFLSGLRPTTTGIMDNQTQFRRKLPNVVTLPQLFRKNGYETFSLGKVFHRGLSPDETREEMDDSKSFDRVFYGKATPIGNTGNQRNMSGGTLAWCRWLAANGQDSDQPDGQLADEAVKIIQSKRQKPFFLAVGFYRPHDPFQSPKKYFDLYAQQKLEPPYTPEGYLPPYPHSIGGGALKSAFDKFTDQDKREFLQAYYAGVSFMDAQVGKILDALRKRGLSKNTVVVFIGDHGYELGLRNWWNKNTFYERSCQAPLIVRMPKAKGNGKSTRSIVEFIDIYPTLSEVCGLKETPDTLEGRSFRHLLDKPTEKHKEGAQTIIQRGSMIAKAIRTDRFRYIEWDGGKRGAELYDHTNDPLEWKNLADRKEFEKTRESLSELLR